MPCASRRLSDICRMSDVSGKVKSSNLDVLTGQRGSRGICCSQRCS